MATNLSRKSKRHLIHGASAGLPRLRPVLLGGKRPRPGHERDSTTSSDRDAAGEPAKTVAGLIRAVIVAINARGMCATAAARVAALPSGDMDHIASLCRCADCLRLRAN